MRFGKSVDSLFCKWWPLDGASGTYLVFQSGTLHHLTREASGTSFDSSSAMKFASAASPG